MNYLELHHFLAGDEFCHVHRAELRGAGKQARVPHGHTFCELFVVEQGIGTHLLLGSVHRLESGQLWLIRQETCHALYSRSGLRLVNVAFPTESLEAICSRYGFDVFSRSAADLKWVLDEQGFSAFRGLLNDFFGRPNRQLSLELFLLQVFSLIESQQEPDRSGQIPPNPPTYANSPTYANPPTPTRTPAPSSAPSWVREYYQLLSSEDYLAESVQFLADRIGFSREHASRQIQHYYGNTPSAIHNLTRAAYARRELRMSDTPIVSIAFACGFSSLSQFYAVFRESMGMTPAACRKQRP